MLGKGPVTEMIFEEPFRFSFADAVVLREELHPTAVGSVSTGAPGSDASVTLREDGDVYYFDFVIPRGLDGHDLDIDDAMSDFSDRPVANAAIKAYVDEADAGLNESVEALSLRLDLTEGTPYVGMSATDNNVTLEPNVYYAFPVMSTLTVSLGGTVPSDKLREYRFRFSSGPVATVLTLPDNIMGLLPVEPYHTYDVAILDGFLRYQSWDERSWAAIRRLVRMGRIGELYQVGDQLTCLYRGEPVAWDIIGIDCETPSDGIHTHSLTLQLHESFGTMPFEQAEAICCTGSALPTGNYRMAVNGRDCDFTLSQPLPAGGQIAVTSWSGSGITSFPVKLATYTGPTATEAIETNIQVSAEPLDGTIALTDINEFSRARYGYNRWKTSSIRKWLSSRKTAGQVWTPDNRFSRPPVWAAGTDGFLNGWESDFVNVLGWVEKTTLTPESESETQPELVFLPSKTEIYAGKNNGVTEGAPYPFYSAGSDLPAPGDGEDSNRIRSREETPCLWYLRSPIAGTEFNREQYVTASGKVSMLTPITQLDLFPIVCII